MKKIVSIILFLSLILVLCACGKQAEKDGVAGGWTLSADGAVPEQAQSAFDKAMEGLVGVNYTPVALLGTQLVSGTNYSLLCEATVVYPDAKPSYAVVTVYENLQGVAEIRNIAGLDLGQIAETGAVEAAEISGGTALGGWTVDRESSFATEDTVLHLASQLVSGTNHCLLCRGEGWSLRYVYESLDGSTEVKRTVPLDPAALSQPAAD